MSEFVENLLNELTVIAARLGRPPDPEQIVALLEELGWEPGAGLPIDEIVSAVGGLADVAVEPPASLVDVNDILIAVKRAVSQIRDLRADVLTNSDANALGQDIAEGLLIEHLRSRVPVVWAAMVLVGLADPAASGADTLVTEEGDVVRRKVPRSRLQLERIPDLLSRPVQSIAHRWWPLGLSTQGAADEVAATLLPALAELVHGLGGVAVAGFRSDAVFDLGPEGNAAAAQALSLAFPIALAEGTTVRPGLTLALLPAGRGGPGVAVTPRGTTQFETVLGSWKVGLESAGQAPAIVISPSGTAVAPGGDRSVRVAVEAARSPAVDEPAVRLGGSSGTRVEIGGWAFRVFLVLENDQLDTGGEVELRDVALVVAAEPDDGFLGTVLPEEGLCVRFSGALGWSRSRGLYVRGSVRPGAGDGASGLATDISLGLDAGPIRPNLAHVRLVPVDQPQPGADFELATSLTVALGPFTATISQIGLRILVRARPDGNLGPINLELAIAPPAGLGLSLQTEAVSGGGYLEYDPTAGRYSGVCELTILDMVSVKVIGIVTTRTPDGRPGFALLLIITAEGFTPVQLGMGFVLTGIGGLIALNRTVDLEVVRGGLRNGLLDSVLFIEDPVANAPRVVQTLDSIFPQAADRLLVGPLVELAWGTPPIIRARLALLLELPQPVRVILLAALALVLPDEKTPVITVHVDALGALDLHRGELSLDAALHDSRLWTWTLSGEMALRLSWKDHPSFLLSIGGFHPRFRPPPGIRSLDRLSLSLTDGNNPRVRFETYLAVTSNSLQMGARVEVYAEKAGFGLKGGGAFDGLLRWDPFGLDVAFRAWVQVFTPVGSLLAAALEVGVTGPEPWHVHGSVTVKLLMFSGTATLDFTVGEAARPREREKVDIAQKLRKALAHPDAVTAALPATEAPGAVLTVPERRRETDPLVVHPMATIEVRQKVVPLGVSVSRLGVLLPTAGTRTYDLDINPPDGLHVAAAKGLFASAQFQDIPDEQRLTAPSFAPMDAGIALVGDATRATPASRAVGSALAFEVYEVLALEQEAVRQETPSPADAALLDGISGGSLARTVRRGPA